MAADDDDLSSLALDSAIILAFAQLRGADHGLATDDDNAARSYASLSRAARAASPDAAA